MIPFKELLSKFNKVKELMISLDNEYKDKKRGFIFRERYYSLHRRAKYFKEQLENYGALNLYTHKGEVVITSHTGIIQNKKFSVILPNSNTLDVTIFIEYTTGGTVTHIKSEEYHTGRIKLENPSNSEKPETH